MRSFKAAPEVLSAWMDERKLTAAELSRQTGIDAGILRKIMTGRETAVSTRNLMTLARYFGLSMQELIDAFSGQERPHLRPLLSVHTMFTASDPRQTCNLTESVVYYGHRERSLGSMASRKER